jgi:tetratricopeptide (TPR) repeat protein
MADDDDDVYELFTAGRKHLADGEWLRAIPPLERARDLEPGKGSIRESLGVAYLRARRFADAETELQVAVELAANDHYAYFLLGGRRRDSGASSWRAAATSWPAGCDRASDTYRQALDALPKAG